MSRVPKAAAHVASHFPRRERLCAAALDRLLGTKEGRVTLALAVPAQKLSADKISENGLAISRPAMSGAEPWAACPMACSRPR